MPTSEPSIDDLHLALYCAYLPRLRTIEGSPADVEWDANLLGLTRRLEESAALEFHGVGDDDESQPIARRLKSTVASVVNGSPALSAYLETEASPAQFREFLIHKASYHLIEADPHTFALPRLEGKAKAAMLEIQADEYGGGDASQMHQRLFSDLMRSVDLEPDLSNVLGLVPGTTLAITTTVMRFATHASTMAEAVGHLCALEMTSTEPNARYGAGLRRAFGQDADARFFDVHVTADAVHEQIAMADLAGALVAADPGTAEAILRGARVCLAVDARASGHILDAFRRGRSSLL